MKLNNRYTNSSYRNNNYGIYRSNALGNFSNSNKVESDVNKLINFKPGKTLWLVFQSIDFGSTTTENILGCNSGGFGSGKGWWITRQATTGNLYILSAKNSYAVIGALVKYGINRLCLVWKSSNDLYYSINGGSFTYAGTFGFEEVDETCKSYIGTESGSLGGVAFESGRLISFALWDREATSNEAKKNSFSNKNRFILDNNIINDEYSSINFNVNRDWDGSSCIINTQGSNNINFNVIGNPSLFKIDEKRVVMDNHFYFDSLRAEENIDSNNYKYTKRDTFANIRLISDGYHIGAEVYSTLYSSFPGQSNIGVFNNWEFEYKVSAEQNSKPQLFDLQIGSGLGKNIIITEGACTINGVGPERLGTFIEAIRVPLYLNDGITKNKYVIENNKLVDHRLVLLGDSILTGFVATNIVKYSPINLLRSDYPGGVTGFTAGYDNIKNLSGDEPITEETASLLSKQLNGKISNTLWIQLGTNDYGYIAGESSHEFGIDYARLVDKIHEKSPSTMIYCQTPIQRISPSSESANSTGDTLDDYRNEISTIVSSRSEYCVFVDGTLIVSNSNISSDGVHPTNEGMIEYKNFIKTKLGY